MIPSYEQPAHDQVVDLPGLSITPRLRFGPNHDHTLELKNYDKRFTCDGCKEDGFRMRYRCKHCDYELHEHCMHPKPTISHHLFEGSVFKFRHEKPTCGILCRVHTKSCEACGNGIHGYHYEAKDLYLHPLCAYFQGKVFIAGETFVLRNKGKFKCFWCDSTEKTDSGWSYVSESTECVCFREYRVRITRELRGYDGAGGLEGTQLSIRRRNRGENN